MVSVLVAAPICWWCADCCCSVNFIEFPPLAPDACLLGFLNGDQAGWVRDEVVEVLHLLRPMAVSLVDAW